MKLIDECNQLRCKLKNSPKILQPDIENLQEQLKDTQEVNVKLKLDLDSYKVILVLAEFFFFKLLAHVD